MPLRDDLLAEIPGANPSGSSLRYDPVTDIIKEARREDVDVNQGDWKTAVKTADYPQVIKLASDAIAKKGKDLQLAVWLVDAHVRREGFSLLAPSFEFLRKLLEQFWETVYPEIEDGDLELRAAPLDWLGNKLEHPLMLLPITSNGLTFANYKQSRIIGYEQDAKTDEKKAAARAQAIADGTPTAEEFDEAIDQTPRTFYEKLQESFAAALEKLRELTDFCDEKFGDVSPSFVKTRSTIEAIAQQARVFLTKKPAAAAPAAAPAPAAQAPVAQTPAPVAAAPPSAAAPAPAPQPVVSAGPDPSDYDDAVLRLGALCRYLRENTNFDTSALLLIRAFRWGELRAYAPEIRSAMLKAPPSEIRSGLKERFAASDWDGVLALTESAMELPCGRGWLDLQRYTVLALERKGEDSAIQAGFIQNALRTFLQEMPGLLDETMADDTPVANPETRAWITNQVLSGVTLHVPVPAQTAAASQSAFVEEPEPVFDEMPPELEPDEEPEAAEPPPPDIFEEALAAARERRPADALEMISRQLASERSGRGRFRRRTQLAHLLMLGGHRQIALPILQQLAAEIDQRQLADWERSEALAYPVDLLLRCIDGDSDADESANRKELYARLCQLDPVRALKSATS